MSSDMQRGGEYRAGCKGRFDTTGPSLGSPCEYPISPASTLHGGQPDGAHIADSTLAGRLPYEYTEMMDGRFPSDDMEYIEV